MTDGKPGPQRVDYLFTMHDNKYFSLGKVVWVRLGVMEKHTRFSTGKLEVPSLPLHIILFLEKTVTPRIRSRSPNIEGF